jgi:cell division protein FtsB
MHKILFICLIAIIVIFQYQLKLGHGGSTSDINLKQLIAQQNAINAKLMERNSLMEIRIAALKGSTDSIEARSRSELNLIKPGEMLILLPGSDLNLTLGK